MIAVFELKAELDKLVVFARTATSPEIERKKGIARLAPYRDGAIFASKFSGTGGWEQHPNGDELLHIVAGTTRLYLLTDDGLQSQVLQAGTVVIIPQGLWHRFESSCGVTLMAATPQPTDHPEVDVDDPHLLYMRDPAA